MFDFKWNCGIIFGITQDEIIMVFEEQEEPEESTMVQLHLGIFTISYLFT